MAPRDVEIGLLSVELAGDYRTWHREQVWRNELGVRTHHLTAPGGRERHFLKVAPPGVFPTLADEAARMRWAVDFTPWLHEQQLYRDDLCPGTSF